MTTVRSRGDRSTAYAFGRNRPVSADWSAVTARYSARPPWRATSRETTDGFRLISRAISLNSRPSAKPREISSRSTRVNMLRTAGILSHRPIKIKCYD
ncbi:hypothetical protein SAMN04489716_2548 [Actinoplanes derwentensis]|uniref:Uncharacterized protein n=1 Tax=Actinoplanes derwentensis TaxID=113562 RepID=A0A1H1XRG2_9ACTN|nr:hypothetical protein SAMN04489716_2548 [Actinoplanes derwentensis]